MVPDADYRIKLQVFEGPLDLLLFLIRKNELDIYDIPIESVTRQYLEVLRHMQQLDLDLAGEFFVMAATLMEIKSRMLLPKGQHAIDPNADEEEVDPRWELVHQLLQYKKFKEAAAELEALAETRQNLMERYMAALSAEETERPLRSVDRIELWNAFNIVLRRLAEKLVVGEIHDEVVTVADQMEWLLARTKTEKSFIFTSLFPEGVTLRRLVATFLAMLELTRLKRLRVRQSDAFEDIEVQVVEADAAAPAPAPVDTDPAATSRPPSEQPAPSPESAPSGDATPSSRSPEPEAPASPQPEPPSVESSGEPERSDSPRPSTAPASAEPVLEASGEPERASPAAATPVPPAIPAEPPPIPPSTGSTPPAPTSAEPPPDTSPPASTESMPSTASTPPPPDSASAPAEENPLETRGGTGTVSP